MLLEQLVAHADQLDLPPTMYEGVEIRWYIDIDQDGVLKGFVPVTGGEQQKGARVRGKRHFVPQIIRANAIQPKLLADNGEYVLGIARDPAKQERVDNAHARFRALVDECARATGDPLVNAASEFLAAWDEGPQPLPEEFDPSHNITFRVDDAFPVDLPAVRKFWAEYTAGLTDDPIMECLVCGENKPVQRNLPMKIRRVPDGQPAGTSLVSVNTNAFESYALERSLNSPICRDCGEKFANVANALITDEQSRLFVRPVVYLFWSRGQEAFHPVPLLRAPEAGAVDALVAQIREQKDDTGEVIQEQQRAAAVKEVFKSPRTGRVGAGTIVDGDAFYAVGLSASGGRTVVRHWLETTVDEAKTNLARWFALQRLAAPDPQDNRPYSVFALAASLFHDANRLPARLPTLLMRTALHGDTLPLELLTLAVQRNRSEQGITRNRATLIKMVLTSQGGDPMDEQLIGLNKEHPNPAYHCGRLLAQLEQVQRRAIRGIKATITDRYFGSAASAPASVFGGLIRDAQAHLSKLRKNESTAGAAWAMDEEIGQICERIGDKFPATLNVKDQALFSLGYYHQRTAGIAAARAHRAGQNETTDNEKENNEEGSN